MWEMKGARGGVAKKGEEDNGVYHTHSLLQPHVCKRYCSTRRVNHRCIVGEKSTQMHGS